MSGSKEKKNCDDGTILGAIRMKNIDRLRYFLDKGLSVNDPLSSKTSKKHGDIPLVKAVQFRAMNIAELMLQPEYKASSQTKTKALNKLLCRMHSNQFSEEMVWLRLLLHHGAESWSVSRMGRALFACCCIENVSFDNAFANFLSNVVEHAQTNSTKEALLKSILIHLGQLPLGDDLLVEAVEMIFKAGANPEAFWNHDDYEPVRWRRIGRKFQDGRHCSVKLMCDKTLASLPVLPPQALSLFIQATHRLTTMEHLSYTLIDLSDLKEIAINRAVEYLFMLYNSGYPLKDAYLNMYFWKFHSVSDHLQWQRRPRTLKQLCIITTRFSLNTVNVIDGVQHLTSIPSSMQDAILCKEFIPVD